MLITIAICTLNRAESLRRTLASLAAMRIPDGFGSAEIVVVNNGCTDHTDDAIDSFAPLLPIRRAFEPQPGLCHARNRAVDAAKGDYIIWTDDDVIVDHEWLAAYADAFRRWPDAAVFGGPITPKFEPQPPRWLADSYRLVQGAFAMRDFGDQPHALTIEGEHIPYGANLAIRAAEQRAFRFNPDLGHAPGRRRTSDEVDVITRILESGAEGRWVPDAKVDHCIGKPRQTAAYIAGHFMAVGETRAFLGHIPTPDERGLWFGVQRWRWRQLAEQWARYRLHRLTAPASVWVTDLSRYAMHRGMIRYWQKTRHDGGLSGVAG